METTSTITIDPRITWVTLAEAKQAWEIASSSTIAWAYWNQKILMRKSMGTWIVYVPDMVNHFGMPKISLVVSD